MIYSLHGKIIAHENEYVVIETAGIGFSVYVTHVHAKKLKKGALATIFCFLNNEQAQLFGFATKEEKNFFELLLCVPGIGPKNALKIMNTHSVADIQSMIALDRADLLSARGGVSKKTAAKIILELQSKIVVSNAKLNNSLSDDTAVADALKSLGYAKKDIAFALDNLEESSKRIEERIKKALQLLAKRHS